MFANNESRGMMVYIVLNTMIWGVVKLTSGKVTPANWHEKEVYSFGLGRRDLPWWVQFIRRKLFGEHITEVVQKDGIELADCDSTINHGSRSASAEGKQIQVTANRPNPRHMDYDLPSLD
jgi:adenine/guanine/hypoxanthine permease